MQITKPILLIVIWVNFVFYFKNKKKKTCNKEIFFLIKRILYYLLKTFFVFVKKEQLNYLTPYVVNNGI